MTVGDLHAVHRIERASYPRPWSVELFRVELERDDRRYLVATRAGRVVGYAGLALLVDEAHVLTVAVDPAHRGRAVGSRLVLDLLCTARAVGAVGATLEVRPSNDAARRLYERFGFVVEGRRPRYYADSGEDALLLWRRDLQAPAFARLLTEQARVLAAASTAPRGKD